jgi:hypothetical protein
MADESKPSQDPESAQSEQKVEPINSAAKSIPASKTQPFAQIPLDGDLALQHLAICPADDACLRALLLAQLPLHESPPK